MAEDRIVADLAAFARRHHVHFDVDPEVVILRAGGRLKIGFEVRLWAVHPKGARALPGCRKCRALAAELRRLAAWAIPAEHRAAFAGIEPRVEIEPLPRALYDSREVPGADEVAVSIRLAHREGWDRPIDAPEERCLRDLRERLRAVGVRER